MRPGIVKRQRTVKKLLHVIFFGNKDPLMQLPVPKDRTVTRAFYRNVFLKKLKAHFKRRRPKTGLKYLHLLHDNAPAHKARIVTKFLESEKMNVLPHPPFSPDLAPCDYFLFSTLKFHLSGKRYMGLLYISASWVCLFRIMNGAFKIGFTAWTSAYVQVESMLTLSQTSPGFYVSSVQVFWKHCGKRSNCS